ncbi:hypothetical protein H4R18_001499 [Coemansia javaensis]|uniref:Uncharacterized protein n=1 Tax=Coemansia javaensis TaxID=2761396 RepID=A0A9W8HJJ4_9FUNG|nr:hypothetical protein H4R18_001499 [Coemansia javaensis]
MPFAKVDEAVYQRSPAAGGPGIRAQVYKHSDSNLRVVLCSIAQPLFSVNIYVPTVAPNNKGVPHTLEHLVFCGSRRFPHRGYLDSLANCNLAHGTNAWTSYDHTCYTLSAASEEAVANVLPAYLDHVLSPLLRDDHFITEVYHFDEEGREQGVVFSEMLACESDENELASSHLERLMFPERSAYSRSYGGLTPDIATLTNKEIVDYHRQFYDANNVTVVMAGPFSEQFARETLQSIPADIVRSNGCDSRAPIDCSPPPADAPRAERVPFPSSDTEVGSVMVGWRGPPSEDAETLAALDILMLYLADDPSSPLCQRFVERPAPLASEVSAYTMPMIPTAIFMLFAGVPHPPGDDEGGSVGCGTCSAGSCCDSNDECEDCDGQSDDGGGDDDDEDIPHLFDEGYFKDVLVRELRRIHDSRFDGDEHALENAAQKYSQRLVLRIEDKPDATVQEFICSDIVASHFSPGRGGRFSIGTHARLFDTIEALARRPAQYWLDLLRTWLLDAPAYHVVMTPDPGLGAALDEARRAAERKNAAGIKDKAAHARRIAEAVAAMAVDLPSDVRQSIPHADPARTVPTPHALSHLPPPPSLGLVSAIQVVETETTLPDLRLHIAIGALPDELRPYLALYNGLMQCSDLVLPAGVVYDAEASPLRAERRVDYKTVDKRLAELTSSTEDSVGISTVAFSHCWVDEVYTLTMRVSERNFEVAVRWLLQALVFADFTAERIVATARNLLNSLLRVKQDGDAVLEAACTRLTSNCSTGRPDWIERHISLFDQERVLKAIIAEAQGSGGGGGADRVAVRLGAIKRALIRSAGGFLTLGIPAGGDRQSYIGAVAREWAACVDNYADPDDGRAGGGDVAPVAARGPFPMAHDSRMPRLEAPLLVHIPMRSLQAAHLEVCVKLELCSTPSSTSSSDFEDELRALPALDHYALLLLTELLHRTDGPLYNAVRGSGYAYGASFSIQAWSRILALYCTSASDVSRAFLAVRELVEDLGRNWDCYVGEFEIAMARSAITYAAAAALATPEGVVSACVSLALDGFASVEQRARWRNAHLAAVTQADLRRVYEHHIRRLVDPAEPAVAVILSPHDTELLPALGPYERKSLEDVGALRLP